MRLSRDVIIQFLRMRSVIFSGRDHSVPQDVISYLLETGVQVARLRDHAPRVQATQRRDICVGPAPQVQELPVTHPKP